VQARSFRPKEDGANFKMPISHLPKLVAFRFYGFHVNPRILRYEVAGITTDPF
jgi:hypothetical protein